MTKSGLYTDTFLKEVSTFFENNYDILVKRTTIASIIDDIKERARLFFHGVDSFLDDLSVSLFYDFTINNTKRRDVRDLRNIFSLGDEMKIFEIASKNRLIINGNKMTAFYSFAAMYLNKDKKHNKELREYLSLLLSSKQENPVFRILLMEKIPEKYKNVLIELNYVEDKGDGFYAPTPLLLHALAQVKRNIFVLYPFSFYSMFVYS